MMGSEFNIDDYMGEAKEVVEVTPPIKNEKQLEEALPVYDVPVVKVVDRTEDIIKVSQPVASKYNLQTLIDWIRNIERDHTLSFDAMMLKLESGLIPINNTDHNWQPNEVIAEEILIEFHKQRKEVSTRERVDEIIEKHTEGKAQEMAKYFVKMVEYKEELMTPILALDSAFFTKLEEVDMFQAALARKQISLLREIRDGIKELNSNQ